MVPYLEKIEYFIFFYKKKNFFEFFPGKISLTSFPSPIVLLTSSAPMTCDDVIAGGWSNAEHGTISFSVLMISISFPFSDLTSDLTA